MSENALIQDVFIAPMPKQKPGKSIQTYGTPEDFLMAVKAKWAIDEFSVDAAASRDNAVCKAFIDEAQDALKCSWTRTGVVWCNPPFANLEKWVRKAYIESQQGSHILMLVPASPGANWWRDWVHHKATVTFVNGRLTFVGQEDPYPKDVALLEYPFRGQLAYNIWTWR